MEAVRPSALAGLWYTADPQELKRSIDDHLSHGLPLDRIARRPPIAIIAPHAGHRWSGDAAGQAFRLFVGEAGQAIHRVILLGPSHTRQFRGGSILRTGAYETPLGRVPLDAQVVHALLEEAPIQSVPDAHREEHCLEIELPFLQRVLDHPFEIVPILISQMDPRDWKEAAEALIPHIDDQTLIVISSDFTHYGNRFGYVPFRDDPDRNLRRLDKGALVPILARDPQAFARYKAATGISVCGYHPIGVLIELLNNPRLWERWGGGAPEGRVLDYYRSADLIGDFEGSVSYASVGFFRPGDLLEGEDYPERLRGVVPLGQPETGGLELTDAEESYLLGLARQTLEDVLAGKSEPRADEFPDGVSAEKLTQVTGVFVTLHKAERLRGCIGNIIGRKPLVEGVIDNALSAALEDPRFPAVTASEVPDLHIEISVLTPPRSVSGPGEIEIGRHGVLLTKNGRRAVFLPQVATEQGWDRDTMLSHLARKAGLATDAWKEGATFEVFEALVFSEPH